MQIGPLPTNLPLGVSTMPTDITIMSLFPESNHDARQTCIRLLKKLSLLLGSCLTGRNAEMSLSTNDSAAFKWKLHCHWLKGHCSNGNNMDRSLTVWLRLRSFKLKFKSNVFGVQRIQTSIQYSVVVQKYRKWSTNHRPENDKDSENYDQKSFMPGELSHNECIHQVWGQCDQWLPPQTEDKIIECSVYWEKFMKLTMLMG